ncbi:hypothetical protein RHGRI_034763 [Rhododendron griersonianum]|uniref:Uncharacterized protein n=1 Tax=Rhododendron griersonianum TaxID=479676 RepID=A0AAV6I5B6_9ERIC|nr:hypothetical protein RHGRI_034763 [Rhododendron griersonianum]
MVAAELPSLPQLQFPRLWLTHENLLCNAVNHHGCTVFVNKNAQIYTHVIPVATVVFGGGNDKTLGEDFHIRAPSPSRC